MVCGSDHLTYGTICSLNEESVRRGPPSAVNPALAMQYWGPCKEVPVIISKPDDSYGPLGANLTLDCEARGYPAPTITWRFVNTEGKTISLPSKCTVGNIDNFWLITKSRFHTNFDSPKK